MPIMRTRRDSRRAVAIFLALLTVLLAACAAGDARFTAADPAGFWAGLWHGIIAPFAFVIGLFTDRVEIYERANSGGWYDFGFLLGVFCFGGCGGHTRRRWRTARANRRDFPGFPAGRAHVKVDIDWTGNEPGPAALPDAGTADPGPKTP